MKKVFTLLLFSVIYITGVAQNYLPTLDSNNVWYYTGNWLPILQQSNPHSNSTLTSPNAWNTYDHYTGTDTTIGSTTYKKLYNTSSYPNQGTLQGFVREDTSTKALYYFNPPSNPSEYLLYNYSMQIGDSIDLPFVSGGYFFAGYYRLDSIQTKSINSISRKVFYLNKSGSGTLIWIEGIGNQADFVYTENYMLNWGGGPFMWSCGNEYPYAVGQLLTCFYHDNNRVYYDSCAVASAMSASPCLDFQDSCHYGNVCTGMNKYDSFSKVKIYPNPACDHAVIEFESKVITNLNLEIYDALGKLVKKKTGEKINFGKNEISICNGDLTKGIYLIKFSTQNQLITQRFIIE